MPDLQQGLYSACPPAETLPGTHGREATRMPGGQCFLVEILTFVENVPEAVSPCHRAHSLNQHRNSAWPRAGSPVPADEQR